MAPCITDHHSRPITASIRDNLAPSATIHGEIEVVSRDDDCNIACSIMLQPRDQKRLVAHDVQSSFAKPSRYSLEPTYEA